MMQASALVLVAIVLAGCDAEDDTPVPPPVVVQPEPATKAVSPDAAGGLGAELALEVEKAKVRCKGAQGIDLAPDLDGNVTGAWIGEYRYDAPGTDPVLMDATLTASAGRLSGRTTEPNTFAARGPSELGASVVGDVLAGGRIAFMKTYEAGDVKHSVLYVGQLDARGREISGRWRTQGITGTFKLERAGLRG